MAKITPTLTLSSFASDYSVSADQGPLSIALSLSVTDALTVDDAEGDLHTVTTTRTQILDGSSIHGSTSSMDPGTDGCFLYMKNADTTTGNNIHVGIIPHNHVSNDPLTPAEDGNTTSLDGTTQETARTFTLLPGEFAWFPWDYTGDIYVESAQNSPTMEVWRFDRG